MASRNVRAGGTAEEALRRFGLRPPMLSAMLDATDPFQLMFGCPWDLLPDDDKIVKAAKSAQKNIGQLLLGGIAERVCERIYKAEIGTEDLRLEDDRGKKRHWTGSGLRALTRSSRPWSKVLLEP